MFAFLFFFPARVFITLISASDSQLKQKISFSKAVSISSSDLPTPAKTTPSGEKPDSMTFLISFPLTQSVSRP